MERLSVYSLYQCRIKNKDEYLLLHFIHPHRMEASILFFKEYLMEEKGFYPKDLVELDRDVCMFLSDASQYYLCRRTPFQELNPTEKFFFLLHEGEMDEWQSYTIGEAKLLIAKEPTKIQFH